MNGKNLTDTKWKSSIMGTEIFYNVTKDNGSTVWYTDGTNSYADSKDWFLSPASGMKEVR